MARLPDEADEAAYDAMPIEEFGAAMLRGMGWSEGQVLNLSNFTQWSLNWSTIASSHTASVKI